MALLPTPSNSSVCHGIQYFIHGCGEVLQLLDSVCLSLIVGAPRQLVPALFSFGVYRSLFGFFPFAERG